MLVVMETCGQFPRLVPYGQAAHSGDRREQSSVPYGHLRTQNAGGNKVLWLISLASEDTSENRGNWRELKVLFPYREVRDEQNASL